MRATRVRHKHIHSSGRYDRSADQIRDALEKHFTRDKPDVYTSTESANQRHRRVIRAVAAEHGYAVRQGSGRYDDCVIAVRKERFKVARVWDDSLSDLPQNRGKGGPLHEAITVLLVDRASGTNLIYTVSHLTAGVEGLWSRARMAYRERVWRTAHGTWSRRTSSRRRTCRARVVMVSDWNLNLEKRRYRALLKSLHPRLRLTWLRFPGPGTHHGRVIDASLTNLTVVEGAHLLGDDAASDHRPYAEILA